jgi:hypothetical protein
MAGDGYAEREVVSLSSPAPVLCFLLFSQPRQMSFVKISGNSNCAKEGLQYVKHRSTCAHGRTYLGTSRTASLGISSLGLDLYSSGGEIAGANEFREDQWKFQLRERRLAVREVAKYVRTWPHVLGYFTCCKPGHFVTWSRLVLEWWRDCRMLCSIKWRFTREYLG